MAAVIVPDADDAAIRGELNTLRATPGRNPSDVLHFQKMTHSQRIHATIELARFPLAVTTSVIICKDGLYGADGIPATFLAQPDPMYLCECSADRLSAPALEDAVLVALRCTYDRRDLLVKAVARAQRKLHDTRPRYEELLRVVDVEIASTEENIQRYLSAFESRTMPEANCGNRVQVLSERLRQLRTRRAELVASSEDDPPASEVDLDALIPEVTNILSAETERPALKAALRVLIEEVRVESRDANYPTFRVPTHTPVRELSGLVRPRTAGAYTVPVVRGASSGSSRVIGWSSDTTPSSTRAIVTAPVIGLVVDAIRNSESRRTGGSPIDNTPSWTTID